MIQGALKVALFVGFGVVLGEAIRVWRGDYEEDSGKVLHAIETLTGRNEVAHSPSISSEIQRLYGVRSLLTDSRLTSSLMHLCEDGTLQQGAALYVDYRNDDTEGERQLWATYSLKPATVPEPAH